MLGTKEGVDRAFKKLDDDQAEREGVVDGRARSRRSSSPTARWSMTTAWNGRIYDAVKNSGKNFKIVWDGQGMDFNLWAMPKGSKNKELAEKFVAFTVQPGRDGAAVEIHLLRPDTEGGDRQGAGGHPARSADRAGEHQERLRRVDASSGPTTTRN